MEWYFWLGIIAAICIAAFSMPQLVYTIKTKNTSGVSLWMFILLAFGDLCFVIQGIGILADKGLDPVKRLSSGLPLLLANLISCTIAVIVLAFKIRNKVWSKKFSTTEKDFCENYETYRTKILRAKAEKAEGVKVNEPDNTLPDQTSGAAGNGTAQVA